MKKKKIIIVGIIVLVLSLGISYALINYNIFGRNNGQLVLGNIWMRYRENNQLNIDGNKDIKVNNITFYTVNQVMATQELNELARCIDYFNSNLYVAAEEEIDIQEFCQGTGTRNGMTLQQMWDSSYQEEGFMEEVGNEFINNNIMILENDVYIVNPIMATQELNELGKCIVLNSNEEFDEGSDSKSYCKGTGRASNGYTFQENLDNGDWFPTEVLTSFEENNVILAKKISYTSFKINPIMQEEESGTGILGKCESLFNNETFDEGSNAESFCKGTGTMEGGVTFQKLLDEEYNNENFLAEIGYQMLNDKIILPVLDANYFEFTIEGRNTYTKKGIWYEIVLMHGDEHETRSERIKDEFLTFTLTEVIDGEEVQLFNNRSYKDLKNQRIWVETIPASTVKDIEKTYRLYMNFVPYIIVGEVIPNSGKEVDYSFDTWNNEVYGSIKVKVTGDFLEKEVEYKIPEGCFQTADIDDGNVIIVGYDNTCTNALVIPNIINDKNVKEIAPYAFSDLEIVSLKFEKNSSLEAIYENSFTYNNIKSVTIPDSVTYLDCSAFDTNVTINKRADLSCSLTPTDESCFDFEFVDIKTNSNMTDEELAACVSIFDSLELPYDEGTTSENFCKGTGTIDGGITFQQFMYEGVSQPENFMNIIGNQLLENNIITIDVAITNYDASCESDVVIPSEVAGLPVTIIANNCSNNGGKSISNNKFDNIQSNNLVYNNVKSNGVTW